MRFDGETFTNGLCHGEEIARGGIATAAQHPVQRFLAQAGLLRQFLERDFGVDKIAENGKTFFRLAFQQGIQRLGIKRAQIFCPAGCGPRRFFYIRRSETY